MKRIWMLLLATVLLLPAMALAEYDYSEVMDDYDMIVSRYQKAVAESYAYARDDFQGLLNYYEAKPERKAALDTRNEGERLADEADKALGDKLIYKDFCYKKLLDKTEKR